MNTYEVKKRKKLFISIILPLLVRGNEMVRRERTEIIKIFELNDFQELKKYCLKYKLKLNNCNIKKKTSLKKIKLIKEKLLLKVNSF